MGKKTNWTVTEDQTLCRAWLCANNDGALTTTPEHKVASFWNVVHQLFHAELETAVERPINGLKIRWSRINRDVQKFALLFARVSAGEAEEAGAEADSEADADASREDGSANTNTEDHEHEHADATTDAGSDRAGMSVPDAGEDDAARREARIVDRALELFSKEQGIKFSFEACWRLLRFSPKWLQLLANSSGVPMSALDAVSGGAASTALTSASASAAAAAAEPAASSTATSAAMRSIAAASLGSELRTSTASMEAAALSTSLAVLAAKTPSGRAASNSNGSAEDAAATAVVHALKRQSELLEEQNAIALFQMDVDALEDVTARAYFSDLRQRYVKKMRRSFETAAAAEPEPTSPEATTEHVMDEAAAVAAAAWSKTGHVV